MFNKRERDPEKELERLYDEADDRAAVRRDAEYSLQHAAEVVKRKEEARNALAELISYGVAVSEAEAGTQEHPELGPGGRKRRQRRDPDSGTRGRKRRERKHTDSSPGRRKKKHPVPG